MADTRPTLLFYCQHSLGIGHLTRSFALVNALAQAFRVVFLNGGRLPPGVPVPQDMELIDLPPLGMDDGHTVISRDATHDVLAAQLERRRLIDQAVAATQPAVLLVELFPFGRKKFAGEILPLIRAARRQAVGPARKRPASSETAGIMIATSRKCPNSTTGGYSCGWRQAIVAMVTPNKTTA